MIAHSQPEAILTGERFYYTGEPCVNGHVELRYTKRGTCVGCIKMKRAIEREIFRERGRQMKYKMPASRVFDGGGFSDNLYQTDIVSEEEILQMMKHY